MQLNDAKGDTGDPVITRSMCRTKDQLHHTAPSGSITRLLLSTPNQLDNKLYTEYCNKMEKDMTTVGMLGAKLQQHRKKTMLE